MFTNKYRYLIILLLGLYSWLNTLFSEVYYYYGIHAPWYAILLLIVIITGAVWEANRLLQKPLSGVISPLASPGIFLLVFFLLGMLLSIIFSVGSAFLLSYAVKSPPQERRIALKLAFTYGTRINLFLHILNGIQLFFSEYRKKQLEAEELKRISAQAQLQAVRNQVNPHFLFNNLNVLSGMVIKDNPDANKFIEEFSKVYRHILKSQDKELVPLETELEFISPYLHLLEKRFPHSIGVELDINEKYTSWFIVPAALQILIENAIKHNVLSVARPLRISISVNDVSMLVVKNNLQLKKQVEPSTHIGLNNISQRYALINGQNITIEKDQFHFSVAVPLIPSTI